MKQDCLDIGIIQAFLDGELDHVQTARVSGHIATCDACASMLAEAEDESAVVFPALEREFNTLVPTQRLWTRINDSITVERENRPFWQKAWAFLSVGLISPSMAAAAALIVVVGITALVMIDRQPATVNTAKNVTPVVTSPVKPVVPTTVSTVTPKPDPEVAAETRDEQPARAGLAVYSEPKRTVFKQPTDPAPTTAADTQNTYLPGEENYLRTIASLSQSVKDQKDNTMRGSERMSFERDLAVVNDAIDKMRVVVKKDPKNESAKQVLYASYQNKIDLLSSVSQKEELVASLR